MAEEVKSESEKKKEDWMNSKWRPMMGWMYMAVCMTDFVLFPVLWSLVQAVHGGQVSSQWSPITLQGAGLFHMAMGAILGIAAFGRTQEKMAGVNNGGLTTSNISSGSVPLSANTMNTMNTSGFPSTQNSISNSPILISSTGKTMPPPQIDQPL
jgi:hypothetical protein